LENHAKVIKVAEEKIVENEVRMSMEETPNSELGYKTIIQKEVIFSLSHQFLKQVDKLKLTYEIIDTLYFIEVIKLINSVWY
jgi:hypothetical protein